MQTLLAYLYNGYKQPMTNEIIERFFKKQCTAEEAELVVNYFRKNPSALDDYLNKSEWDNISYVSMPKQIRDDVWAVTQKQIKIHNRIIWIKRTAVAASIVGLLGFGFYQFTKPLKTKNTLPAVTISIPAKTKLPEYKILTNNSDKVNHFILQDGSAIDLYPGSQVHYDTSFQNNKREIHLEGEAYFKVAKDKAKPFIVYAGSLTTTALGTEFRIITRKNKPGNITVKLFSGKVAIRSINTSLGGWKDVYLSPGQQLNYNAEKMLTLVEKIGNINKPVARKLNNKVIGDTSTELRFDGTSLSSVIDKLSKHFSARIEYDTLQIKAMNFTGIIKSDSLQNVLKVIARMNDLEIVQEGDKFSIKKISK